MTTVTPLLSIACITYNQEKYIARCIEGMLCQKVNFSYEIIIHDDASTDNTATIVKEYAAKYKDLIRTIIQTDNKWSEGISPMSEYVFPACLGKYVAMCEGDDYWFDDEKLQRHVDFLERNDDYVLVYSDCRSIDEDGRELSQPFYSKFGFLIKRKEGFLQKSLVKGNFIMTMTTLIRADTLRSAEDAIKSDPGYIINIDFTLFLEISRLGKIHYDRYITSAYRIMRESLSHSDDLGKRLTFVEGTVGVSQHFNQKYTIGYNDKYFDRVRLGAELREYANRELYGKYFMAFRRGVKDDWLNFFRLKNYLHLFISLFKRYSH